MPSAMCNLCGGSIPLHLKEGRYESDQIVRCGEARDPLSTTFCSEICHGLWHQREELKALLPMARLLQKEATDNGL